MFCDTKKVEVEPEVVADNALRCPACGEYVTEDMVPLTEAEALEPDPQLEVDP